MPDNPENRWLLLARDGDEEAFAELMSRYLPRIFSLCFSLLGQRQDAEDCTQETFIKAYRSLKYYQFLSSFYTWLYRIAVNTCLDHQRRSSRYLAYSIDQPADLEDGSPLLQIPDEGPLPDEELERQEDDTRLRYEISCLPEHLRDIVVLRDLEQFSYREIAEMLDISEGTVKSRLFRARARLMQALKSWEQSAAFDRQTDDINQQSRKEGCHETDV